MLQAPKNLKGRIFKEEKNRIIKMPAVSKILQILKKTYPDAECSLDYRDTWQLLVAVILSAQCTDKRVNQITPELFKKYPKIKDIAQAPREEIEISIKSAGYYHSKARAIQESAQKIIRDYNGQIPQTMQDLLTLSGVGRKTANVILGVGFQKTEGVVVDVHVARISYRLGWTTQKSPKKIEQDLMDKIPKKEWIHLAHLFINHGRAICKAPTPYCSKCPLEKLCAKQGVAKSY